jgi:predicted metalloprotease with PDZ domain
MSKTILRKLSILFSLLIINVSFALAQGAAITVNVDASDAARSLLHVRETMNVPTNSGGKLDLFYPKWIPGEHSPTGPLNNMVNLHIRSIEGGGKEIVWQRDDVEMFAFHCEIPAGVSRIEIIFDDAAEPGSTASSYLARIKWNRLVLYPRGVNSDDIQVTASLKTPAGWKYATALPLAKENGETADFKPVTLTAFIDSPAIIGKFFKKITLTEKGALHEMDIVADSAKALEAKPETIAGWKELIRQAHAMFGAHHYNSYRFLLTLSDHGGDEGLEHHESSEDGVGVNSFSEPGELLDLGDLLGHEYVHSWNGKYRRPARLATPDFEKPMHGDLLWVYEGLTEYLGKVLPTRSKLWTPENFRESIADLAADMDYQRGRQWRPLVDTARAVQFTYDGSRQWRNARRGADYYDEGALVWMEADVLIRQKSGGKLSLDDFCRKFHGGADTGPMVKPYELDEIVATLNEVVPYDWKGFFNERVYAINGRAPMGGITNGGWKLEYNETPNAMNEMSEKLYKFTSLFYTIGVTLGSAGEIRDVIPGSPADKAGLTPGMIIKKIADTDYSDEAIRNAITAAKRDSNPIVLTVEAGDEEEAYKVDYHGGLLYPHLVRDASKPDLLSDIIKAR